MKIFKLFLLFFLALIFTQISRAQDFEQNRIIVKFKKDSKLYKEWLKSNKSLSLSSYQYLLGDNNISSYLSDELLQYPKKLSKSNLLSVQNNTMESLSRIAIINYQAKVAPNYVAQKLSKYDDFEYAEPIPVKKFYFTPNDPLYSRQYYIPLTNADKAWEIVDSSEKIVVGIVDTGIDYLHGDLSNSIFTNSGEMGKDNKGADKRYNNKDDDGNGFIDDWYGWDFAGADGATPDNDPMPGNRHGTHVAGIIGAKINNSLAIAGTANNVKLLAVKVGIDSPTEKTVVNGYQGILYAAKMGAKVINCSWGGSSFSQAEQEALDSVSSWGALVVGACGNDARESIQYPASYRGALSVSAIDTAYQRAFFSNYNPFVDVSAPGVDIFSTYPGNSYGYESGTSMSAPIASAISAMLMGKFKNFSPIQIKEQIKATAKNIDTVAPNMPYWGKMGKGAIDAFNAINNGIGKSVYLSSYSVSDSSEDGAISRLEPFYVNLELANALSDLKNCRIELNITNTLNFYFLDSVCNIGEFKSGEIVNLTEKIRLRPKPNINYNSNSTILFNVFEDSVFIARFGIILTLAPTYVNMDNNNITATFNSIGNVAFNDYPNNLQGKGLRYKNLGNMLFEGSLIVLADEEKMSDVARDFNTESQNKAFYIDEQIANANFKLIGGSLLKADAYYSDSVKKYNVGVKIHQQLYQFNMINDTLNANDFIISVYTLKNVSGRDYDSLYLGLFLDWDIGASGAYNYTAFNNLIGYAYCKNMANKNLPLAGIELLTPQKLNFYAIDNDGLEGDFGIYSSFGYSKKSYGMTNGLARRNSGVTDVSNLISGGPVKIKNGDSVIFAYAFLAADNQSLLDKIALNARKKAVEMGLTDSLYFPLPQKDSLKLIKPNPISFGEITIEFDTYRRGFALLEIVNSIGQVVKELTNSYNLEPERYTFKETIDALPQGFYLVRLITDSGIYTEPFVIVR